MNEFVDLATCGMCVPVHCVSAQQGKEWPKHFKTHVYVGQQFDVAVDWT